MYPRLFGRKCIGPGIFHETHPQMGKEEYHFVGGIFEHLAVHMHCQGHDKPRHSPAGGFAGIEAEASACSGIG